MDIMQAIVRTPQQLLDKNYAIRCACGFRRDYGYMYLTCERETERHRKRGTEHSVTVYQWDAPQLNRAEMIKVVKLRKRTERHPGFGGTLGTRKVA